MDRGEGALGDYPSMSKRVHTMHVEIRPHLSLRKNKNIGINLEKNDLNNVSFSSISYRNFR